MKIKTTVVTERELLVPDGITRLHKNYTCSAIAGIGCDIECSECALDKKNIIDFLNHVRDNDK